jgi:putative membrane protein
MLLGMIFFWGLVILGVITLLRGGARTRDSDDPGEVLKRRLAAGEITVEEYGRRKTLIERDASSGKPSGEPVPGGG